MRQIGTRPRRKPVPTARETQLRRRFHLRFSPMLAEPQARPTRHTLKRRPSRSFEALKLASNRSKPIEILRGATSWSFHRRKFPQPPDANHLRREKLQKFGFRSEALRPPSIQNRSSRIDRWFPWRNSRKRHVRQPLEFADSKNIHTMSPFRTVRIRPRRRSNEPKASKVLYPLRNWNVRKSPLYFPKARLRTRNDTKSTDTMRRAAAKISTFPPQSRTCTEKRSRNCYKGLRCRWPPVRKLRAFRLSEPPSNQIGSKLQQYRLPKWFQES